MIQKVLKTATFVTRILEEFSCRKLYWQSSDRKNKINKVIQSNLALSKELLNKEQIGNSEPFPVTNLPVYLINSEQIGISEQFCDDQKVP